MAVDVQPKIASVLCLSANEWYRMSYLDWNPPGKHERTVLCVHGLTRNGRDFDSVAKYLATHHRYRVICPDVVGRGKSSWLQTKADYNYTVYCSSIATLIAAINEPEIDYIGTSMGGIIGMMLTSLPGSVIRRFVMNDIGPFVSKEGLNRLGTYVGKQDYFNSLEDAEQYFRKIYAQFGKLNSSEWKHIAVHSTKPVVVTENEYKYALAYDPAIGNVFKMKAESDLDLWHYWERVKCHVLVMHGKDSDILTSKVIKEMKDRREAEIVANKVLQSLEIAEFDEVGHAPFLSTLEQMETIANFLKGGGKERVSALQASHFS